MKTEKILKAEHLALALIKTSNHDGKITEDIITLHPNSFIKIKNLRNPSDAWEVFKYRYRSDKAFSPFIDGEGFSVALDYINCGDKLSIKPVVISNSLECPDSYYAHEYEEYIPCKLRVVKTANCEHIFVDANSEEYFVADGYDCMGNQLEDYHWENGCGDHAEFPTFTNKLNEINPNFDLKEIPEYVILQSQFDSKGKLSLQIDDNPIIAGFFKDDKTNHNKLIKSLKGSFAYLDRTVGKQKIKSSPEKSVDHNFYFEKVVLDENPIKKTPSL